MRRSPHVEPLRQAAADGCTVRLASVRLGISPTQVKYLAKRYEISLAPPPLGLDAATRAGQASAASPDHYRFTTDDRRKAARTRRGERDVPPVESEQQMRARCLEQALARAREASARPPP